MIGHGFTSVFAADLDAFLAFKHAMGLAGASRIWYLKQFDAYCTSHDATVLDQHTIEGWVSEQLARSGHYRSWMSYIRDFGRWFASHRDKNAYVLTASWKTGVVRTQPYLFSSSQIEQFFTAARQVSAVSPWRWQAIPFFTLMHSCGIRTGEARALAPEHVDLKAGTLTILESKGRRSRRLPLTVDVAQILRNCDEISREQFPKRRTFFLSQAGTPVSAAAVGVIFARIWNQAGLPCPTGGPRPRPYDFRHHFAYANLERWAANGTDIAAMLPYLSAYMGHAGIESTYYYVHTSPDFLHAYSEITRESSVTILPEVGFE